MNSKHIILSFKPTNHFLIKGPNKQKTNFLFLRFDILSLSKILYIFFIKNSFIYMYISGENQVKKT